jgi:hypothetical protein
MKTNRILRLWQRAHPKATKQPPLFVRDARVRATARRLIKRMSWSELEAELRRRFGPQPGLTYQALWSSRQWLADALPGDPLALAHTRRGPFPAIERDPAVAAFIREHRRASARALLLELIRLKFGARRTPTEHALAGYLKAIEARAA